MLTYALSKRKERLVRRRVERQSPFVLPNRSVDQILKKNSKCIVDPPSKIPKQGEDSFQDHGGRQLTTTLDGRFEGEPRLIRMVCALSHPSRGMPCLMLSNLLRFISPSPRIYPLTTKTFIINHLKSCPTWLKRIY